MNEIGRKITDKLIEIHGSTDFSIAFLPYKRSMWNSMSSVYEECLASGIDAHCMPIEYACMKQNKEIDYITTDYYLFGEIAEPIEKLEQVDYIAIQYQYQDQNRVTNMLPKYFTKALKERYNCKIIFLPYGIGMGQKHFAIQPGCRDVDYAFLEDEDNMERFIAGWKYLGIDFAGRCWAFGSPKFDVVRDLQKIVPPEWKHDIKDRTVVLIINSLAPFLSNPFERMDMYEYFVRKELDEGHTVIFRPHPLLRTTIRSMRPDTEKRYRELIELFESMRFVIVDESEYLERAIAASDRLISDISSVMVMWQETGKPYKIIE